MRTDTEVEIAVRFVLPRDRGSSAHDFSTKFGAPEHTAFYEFQAVHIALHNAVAPTQTDARKDGGKVTTQT